MTTLFVQTIYLTKADANSELPPPMTLDQMVRSTPPQTKMAAMIIEDTAEQVEAVRAQQAAAEAEAASGAGSAGPGAEVDGAMDASDD